MFVIERARADDAAALLDYLKIVGGETENLNFGAEGVPLDLETEQAYLRSQCESADNVQYLAKANGEIIGTASLNRKPRRMSHRREFGISLKKEWWGCGAASALTEAVLAFAKENGFEQLIWMCAATMPAPSDCMKNTAFGSCVHFRIFSKLTVNLLILT